MQRMHLWLVAIAAVACAPAASFPATPIATRAQPTQPAPTAVPVPPPTPMPPLAVVVTSPQADAPLPNPFVLSVRLGLTPADSALHYALRSAAGEVLAEGRLNVIASTEVFSATIAYTMALPGPAALEVRVADVTVRRSVQIPALTVHLLSGLRLTINGVARRARAEVLPKQPHARSPLEWNGWPEHVRVVFDDDPLDRDSFDPRRRQLLILPLQEYRTLFGPAEADGFDALIGDFRALLAAQPASFDRDVLLLPVSEFSQAIWAQVRYLNFEGGRGVRFVTHLTKEISPLTASSLIYTFQGITDDARYYVAAYFPVTTTVLPANLAEVGKAARDLFRSDYRAYAERIAQQLDAQPERFVPRLELLDGLVTSLVIEGDYLGARTIATDVPTGEVTTLLNLRAGPGARFPVIGRLAPGQRVELIARDPAVSWLRVRTPEGAVGWVSRAYVSTQFDLDLLPVQRQ